MFRFSTRAAVVVVGGLAAVGLGIGLAGQTSAFAGAAPGPDLSVSVGTLRLVPADGGGYAGQQQVRIRYKGPGTVGISVLVGQPAGVRFAGEQDFQLQTCIPDATVGPRTLRCVMLGGIADGEVRDLRLKFTSLAEPQERTRRSEPATLTVVNDSDPTDVRPGNNSASFRAILAGTGDGVDRRVYQPAAVPDLSVVAGPGRFVANGDGTWTGTVEVTVAAATDAEHDEVGLSVTGLPEGSWLRVDGQVIGCFDPQWPCRVGPVAQGAHRTVTVVMLTSQAPDAGSPLVVSVTAMRGLAPVADRDATDNSTTSVVQLD